VDPGSGLRRDTLYNLLGGLAPLLVSVVAVPVYLDVLGEARYGVLILVWTLLGFVVGATDLGVARAAANRFARLEAEDAERQRTLLATGAALTFAIGVLAGGVLAVGGYLVVELILDVPADLRDEATLSLLWIAASLPVANVFWMLVACAEGRERFGEANVLMVGAQVLAQAVPLAAALVWKPELPAVAVGLLVGAALSAGGAAVVVNRRLGVSLRGRLDREAAVNLIRYGRWVAVTGILVPFVTALDRLAIGASLGARAVAQYGIPYNLVSRLIIIPSSLARALFPRLSRFERAGAEDTARRVLTALVAVNTPIVVAALVAVDPFLHLWVGDELANAAAPVAEILLLGIWVNALTYIPYTFLQGQNRPDVPAKVHAVVLAPYLLGLWAGLAFLGIEGAAWAWTGRAAVDAVLLFTVTRARLLEGAALVPGAAAVLLAYAGAATLFGDTQWRAAAGAAVVAGTCAWMLAVLRRSERSRNGERPNRLVRTS
jgi:O-antigen/teichoic acid export membrane protein